MATIRDVAEMARVSISTVSHVINQTRFVSQEIRSRVYAAMETLNYQPNAVARSLRNRATRTFGVLLPDSANPYFGAILSGIEEACFENQYNIIIGHANNDARRELTYLDVLLSKQVDGMLLISTGEFERAITRLQEQNVPVVLVDRSANRGDVDVVVADNAQGAYLATQHLINLGHRRIACIAGSPGLMTSTQRLNGFLEALADAEIDLDPQFIEYGSFGYEDGYQACQHLLQRDSRPTAIFACNDLMAIGALRALVEAGLRVPDDVSLVGFDDIPLASYTIPRLTTVSQPTGMLGYEAATALISRILSPENPPVRKVLKINLVTRDSCKPIG